MIKGIILLFNLLGLFLCRLFFPVSVNVSQTAPYSAQINNSFMVQVAINKGDLKGMAKFTEKLPTGLTAVPIDNQGAKTSFDNNTIEFSWDSLPADGIMNISFRVDVSSSANSSKDTLTGKFFYTVDNQKLEADCMPGYINITGVTVVQNSAPVGPHQIDSIKECPGGVFIKRRFPYPSIPPNGDAKITLIIHKSSIIGFAKVEDSLPPGFTAAAIDAGGASFTFVDNIAKFVWQSIPSDSVITISYRILAGSDVNGIHAVSGNFSYIYNSAPLSCSIGTTIFNTTVVAPGDSAKFPVTPPPANASASSFPPIVNASDNNSNGNVAQSSSLPAVNNTPASTDNSTQSAPPSKPANYLVITPSGNSVTNRPDTVKSVPENNQVVASAPANITPAPQTNQANNASNVTPSIPAPQSGLNYRVQIMALHNAVDVSYFSLHKNINVPVNTEMNGGFTKYTVGNYPDYKTVRDAREDFRNRGIVGPFVVSYNSGTRITVQEALMISHQQWYK